MESEFRLGTSIQNTWLCHFDPKLTNCLSHFGMMREDGKANMSENVFTLNLMKLKMY